MSWVLSENIINSVGWHKPGIPAFQGGRGRGLEVQVLLEFEKTNKNNTTLEIFGTLFLK